MERDSAYNFPLGATAKGAGTTVMVAEVQGYHSEVLYGMNTHADQVVDFPGSIKSNRTWLVQVEVMINAYLSYKEEKARNPKAENWRQPSSIW